MLAGSWLRTPPQVNVSWSHQPRAGGIIHKVTNSGSGRPRQAPQCHVAAWSAEAYAALVWPSPFVDRHGRDGIESDGHGLCPGGQVQLVAGGLQVPRPGHSAVDGCSRAEGQETTRGHRRRVRTKQHKIRKSMNKSCRSSQGQQRQAALLRANIPKSVDIEYRCEDGLLQVRPLPPPGPPLTRTTQASPAHS